MSDIHLPKVGMATVCILLLMLAASLYGWSSSAAMKRACYAGFGKSWTVAYAFCVGPFTHATVLHFVMNAIAMAQVGFILEEKKGAVGVSVLTVICLVGNNVLLGVYDLGFPGTCVVGTSGIIFSLLTYWCYSLPRTSVQFWCVAISPILVPWATLLLAQALFWNASFAGHLCGILSGLACYYGIPDKVWECLGVSQNENLDIFDFTQEAVPSSSAQVVISNPFAK